VVEEGLVRIILFEKTQKSHFLRNLRLGQKIEQRKKRRAEIDNSLFKSFGSR